MTTFTERAEFKVGRACELLVAEFMQRHDWLIIPSYDYAGLDHNKPPRLQGLRSAFPIPDLDICRAGERRWLEVKGKASAEWYFKRRVYQHGIHNYPHYVEVQQQTGTPVWLGIVEYSTVHTPNKLGEAGTLLMRRLDALGEPQRGTLLGKPAYFWPREAFSVAYRFTNLRREADRLVADWPEKEAA